MTYLKQTEGCCAEELQVLVWGLNHAAIAKAVHLLYPQYCTFSVQVMQLESWLWIMMYLGMYMQAVPTGTCRRACFTCGPHHQLITDS